jgi:hypothetical protein
MEASDIALGEPLLKNDVLDTIYAMAQGRAATPTFNNSGEDSAEWDSSSSETEDDNVSGGEDDNVSGGEGDHQWKVEHNYISTYYITNVTTLPTD